MTECLLNGTATMMGHFNITGKSNPSIPAPKTRLLLSYPQIAMNTHGTDGFQGTSMSTPVVAGNAAMARQYFREGWYNSGSKNVSASFEPSAALLKAVLINSAEGMEKAGVNPDTSSLDLTLSNPPDEHQVGARGVGGEEQCCSEGRIVFVLLVCCQYCRAVNQRSRSI